IQVLDAKSLKRLLAGLEKKAKENLALRLKYADQPDRFLESEVDLDEHIKSLMQAGGGLLSGIRGRGARVLVSALRAVIAGSPELYPLLLDGPTLPTLLGLLSHENTDIAADVVELLSELTGE
ncbi:Beta-catenin-like protein 1, partial [Tetrabaena socialis]